MGRHVAPRFQKRGLHSEGRKGSGRGAKEGSNPVTSMLRCQRGTNRGKRKKKREKNC